jgi:hypothetical protein
MKLSKEIIEAIEAEYNKWVAVQYAGKDKKDRQSKGQFFTQPPLTIKMLEKFDSITNKDILDPALGAGSLIAAAIIAGADPKRCYGIELDPEILAIAKKRLCPMGVPEKNLKLGNALDSDAYNFDDTISEIKHDQKGLAVKVKDNIIDIEIVKFPRNITKKFTLKLSDPKLKIFLEAAVKKDFWLITNQELDVKFKNTLIMSRQKLNSIANKNKFNSFDDFKHILKS